MSAEAWKPGDDLLIRLVDKSDDDDPTRDVKAIAAINAALAPLGFTVRQHGTDRGFALWYHQTTNPDGTMRAP